MRFDPAVSYTHKSRYLVDATLTGTNDSNLLGNGADNTLRGNAGDNRLDGGAGEDTVVYCRDRVAYRLRPAGPASRGLQVTGEEVGADLLIDVEAVRFRDGVRSVETLLREIRAGASSAEG